jgi:glycosyltransferase involved in cell wall biosynthesis
MNIALLHYSAPPVIGGVESVIGHHARLMARAGHTVRIIAGRGAQTDPQVDFIPVPLVDSRHPDILALKAGLDQGLIPPGFAGAVHQIENALTSALAGVDLLIAHNVCSLHKNLALTAALETISQGAKSPRMVVWHHDLAWTTPRYRTELHDGYPWDLLRRAWSDVWQVVVSDMRQEELSRLFRIEAGDITVVPNGVDLDAFFKLEPPTSELARRLSLLDAAPLLLLPVRITPRKNIELAIRVMGELRRRMPHAALVVTGPPGAHNPANAGYFESLKSLRAGLDLSDGVHFLAELVEATLPDAVIADFYRLADALFLPSREEGFGIPVLEAGLSGLPVFCADIPPLRALTGDRASVFSLDAMPGEVAALIADRLRDDPVYQMKTQFKQTYSWEGVYGQHIAPLLEKAGRHAS